MISPLEWFRLVTAVADREMRQLISRPQEIFFCGFMPVFWVLMIWGLLWHGVITQVPVAFVDNDHSAMTRTVATALSSERSIKLISYPNYQRAADGLKSGEVYGIIEIPFGYTKDQLNGTGSSVSLYLDENRYAVAGTIQAGFVNVMTGLSQQTMLETTLLTGSGVTGAQRVVSGVHSDFYALGNMQFSFLAFLGSNLMPGVIMLAAVLSFVTAIVREIYLYRVNDWLDTAHHNFSAALVGKLAPHFMFYCLMVLAYIALFAGFCGFAPLQAKSLVIWFVSGAACLLVLWAMAILICGIAPTWRFALVVASGYAAPALPFTGFSMPLDSMGVYARMFSKCLPLTWFIQGQSQQWTLGAEIWDMGTTFTAFAALFLIPLVLGIPIFKWKFKRYSAAEKALEKENAV